MGRCIAEQKMNKKGWLTCSKCTHALVVVYLQKASLKAVGLLSRDKAMVVSGEDHLRCKRCCRHKKWKYSRKGKSVERKRV